MTSVHQFDLISANSVLSQLNKSIDQYGDGTSKTIAHPAYIPDP